uniref:Uncharacterized protein n=1 Tax=Serinus canaria TaxID=9135 RepID=A0A8C9L2F5_SERCA
LRVFSFSPPFGWSGEPHIPQAPWIFQPHCVPGTCHSWQGTWHCPWAVCRERWLSPTFLLHLRGIWERLGGVRKRFEE